MSNEILKLNEDYNTWAKRKESDKDRHKRFCQLCDRNMDVLKKRISNLSKQ